MKSSQLALLSLLILQMICSPVFCQSSKDVVNIPMRVTPPEFKNGDYPDPEVVLEVDKEPVTLNMGQVSQIIGYPKKAIRKEIEGSVVIRVLMDEEGKYITHFVLFEGHPILSKAVEKGISYLKCEPAILDGKPTKFWLNVPFNFALKGPPRRNGRH